MIRAYVVTESKTDAEILEKMLPSEIVADIGFVIGPDRYSADSRAATFLTVKRLPLALITPAETHSENAIYERFDFLTGLFRQAAPDGRSKVLIAVPELEVVFFQDQALLEQLLDYRFTGMEWTLAKREPKTFLTTLLGAYPFCVETVLTKLTDEEVAVLRQHPLIQELIEFLSANMKESLVASMDSAPAQ